MKDARHFRKMLRGIELRGWFGGIIVSVVQELRRIKQKRWECPDADRAIVGVQEEFPGVDPERDTTRFAEHPSTKLRSQPQWK